MALTVMDVYKNLPKTNCKDCGMPTCMAFAMQVTAKQKALTDCPHISEDAKSDLADSSAPPMKKITIGVGDKSFSCGQETVLFRHEEKFHSPTGIAVTIKTSLSDDEIKQKAEAINNAAFVRVGQDIKVSLCAVEVSDAASASKTSDIAKMVNVPLVIVSSDAAVMKTAVDAVKAEKPLIYMAAKDTINDFATIAADAKCPLAIDASDLEAAADMTAAAKEKGVEDMVLVQDGSNESKTLKNLTVARRAALRKNFRALGYPSMVSVPGDDEMYEGVLASVYSAKYASIVMVNGIDPAELLPIMTTVQDVYTDPQVPNTVEAKLYEIGSPDENSPVLFTTNFALTYFSVAGEVERSKVSAYISVVDTEGLGVLNAFAGDKISAEKVIKTLDGQKVLEKVSHRKLIIPGYLPIFRAEIEDASEWKEVIIGPETAREIPAFLTSNWN
jgi:acetyl-CoA decarbonylase/synthase complex subunit gamma